MSRILAVARLVGVAQLLAAVIVGGTLVLNGLIVGVLEPGEGLRPIFVLALASFFACLLCAIRLLVEGRVGWFGVISQVVAALGVVAVAHHIDSLVWRGGVMTGIGIMDVGILLARKRWPPTAKPEK